MAKKDRLSSHDKKVAAQRDAVAAARQHVQALERLLFATSAETAARGPREVAARRRELAEAQDVLIDERLALQALGAGTAEFSEFAHGGIITAVHGRNPFMRLFDDGTARSRT